MRARCDPGFTLIEVVVALVVTSFLLVIIMDGAVTARQRTRQAEQREEAVFLARSLIARGTVAPYSEVPELGRSNDLDWRVSQRIVMRDPRGFVGLVLLRAEIVDLAGHHIFSAAVRQVKSMRPLT